MQDNPMFEQQIRNAVASMRERKCLPGEVQEPMLHTWAAQVAWERLRRETITRAVWDWIISVNDGSGLDADDLIVAMEHVGAPCPADLEEN